MKKNEYIPAPVDTDGVTLPPELEALGEVMAKNTHEVWSRQRMNDGWSFGAERSDSEKLHPCLVPYEELPESEKEYDRNTANETLKLIIKLGYTVIPPSSGE